MRWPPSLCEGNLLQCECHKLMLSFHLADILCSINHQLCYGRVYKFVSCDDLKDVGQGLKSVILHAYKAD